MYMRHWCGVALLAGVACGPDGAQPLADASWVVGRYATGAGCSQMSAGEIYTYIIGCTSREFAEIEFFADGRVESVYFGCSTTPESPRLRESARWRATPEDGLVVIEPRKRDQTLHLFGFGGPASTMEVHRTDDCHQLYVVSDQLIGTEPEWTIIHRGEFEYFDPVPTDGCEEEVRAVNVPERPYADEG